MWYNLYIYKSKSSVAIVIVASLMLLPWGPLWGSNSIYKSQKINSILQCKWITHPWEKVHDKKSSSSNLFLTCASTCLQWHSTFHTYWSVHLPFDNHQLYQHCKQQMIQTYNKSHALSNASRTKIKQLYCYIYYHTHVKQRIEENAT